MYWEHISEKRWDTNAIDYNRPELVKVREETVDHPVIYFDMDGVVANWNHEKSEKHPDGVTMEEVNAKGYFRNLDPVEEYVELCKVLYEKGYDVRIASKAKYSAIEEKIAWLHDYLPFITKDKMYFVPIEAKKTMFVPQIKRNDILIDDYNVNLAEWSGSPIKAVTDKNTINPHFPWLTQSNPTYKNLDTITWTLIRDFATDYRQGNGHIEDLNYAFVKSSMSREEFVSICEGFSVPSVEAIQAMNLGQLNKDIDMDIDME